MYLTVNSTNYPKSNDKPKKVSSEIPIIKKNFLIFFFSDFSVGIFVCYLFNVNQSILNYHDIKNGKSSNFTFCELLAKCFKIGDFKIRYFC